jgi:hypothetical protein
VKFLERGELAGDSFDEVGEARGLVVVIGDGEDVDLADMVASFGSWSSRKVPRMD